MPVVSCRNCPDESVQLTVTSPPYNLGKDYEGRKTIDDRSRNGVS